MEIKFRTKEESNKEQLEEFLSLSKSERVKRFLALSRKIKKFPTKKIEEINTNFVISFYDDK
jgi:hypothetical protein